MKFLSLLLVALCVGCASGPSDDCLRTIDRSTFKPPIPVTNAYPSAELLRLEGPLVGRAISEPLIPNGSVGIVGHLRLGAQEAHDIVTLLNAPKTYEGCCGGLGCFSFEYALRITDQGTTKDYILHLRCGYLEEVEPRQHAVICDPQELTILILSFYERRMFSLP
jgi:hypothetical protein